MPEVVKHEAAPLKSAVVDPGQFAGSPDPGPNVQHGLALEREDVPRLSALQQADSLNDGITGI